MPEAQAKQRPAARLLALLRRLTELNVVLQFVGAFAGLAGNYFINERDVLGFYLWVLSNGALIWLQWRVRLWVLTALHATYLLLAFDGIRKWGAVPLS